MILVPKITNLEEKKEKTNWPYFKKRQMQEKNSQSQDFNNNEISESKNKKDGVPKITKKIKKEKNIWNDETFSLKKIGTPETINNEKFKKKYKIHLTFEKDGKTHNKTIRFGDIRKNDYIDDKDLSKRNKLIGKLGNTHNLLHPNFWRMHLLNGTDSDVKNNWKSLVTKMT